MSFYQNASFYEKLLFYLWPWSCFVEQIGAYNTTLGLEAEWWVTRWLMMRLSCLFMFLSYVSVCVWMLASFDMKNDICCMQCSLNSRFYGILQSISSLVHVLLKYATKVKKSIQFELIITNETRIHGYKNWQSLQKQRFGQSR